MKLETALFASIYPLIWLVIAMSKVGEKMDERTISHYDCSLPISLIVLLVPTAVMAYIAGRSEKRITLTTSSKRHSRRCCRM